MFDQDTVDQLPGLCSTSNSCYSLFCLELFDFPGLVLEASIIPCQFPPVATVLLASANASDLDLSITDSSGYHLVDQTMEFSPRHFPDFNISVTFNVGKKNVLFGVSFHCI